MNTLENAKFEYCLNLGDSALILSHRLSEWCGHAPILEEDIALTNISLDLLGQARNFLSLAAETEAKGRTEDTLAYFRESNEFRNFLITEQPNNDYAFTMCRQFFYDLYFYFLFDKLKNSKDEKIAALAEKSHKENTYHLRHSTYWMKCFAAGTDESKVKVQNAVDALWMYTGEFFEVNTHIQLLFDNDIVPNPSEIAENWNEKVHEIFKSSGIRIPDNQYMQKGGRKGLHTEYLGHLLAEMQIVQRTYPGMEW